MPEREPEHYVEGEYLVMPSYTQQVQVMGRRIHIKRYEAWVQKTKAWHALPWWRRMWTRPPMPDY